MKQKRLKRLVIVTIMMVAILFSTLDFPEEIAMALDTITVAPENMMTIKVVYPDGTPAEGIDAYLKDADGNILIKWETGKEDEYMEYGSTGINTGTYFEEPISTFEEAIAPYDLSVMKDLALKGTVNDVNFKYNTSIKFSSEQSRTMQMKYIGEHDTDLTVDANTFMMNIEPVWDEKSYNAKIMINGDEYIINDLADTLTPCSLAAGTYTPYLFYDISGCGLSLTVSDEPTEYVRMRVKLSDLNSRFNDDGTIEYNEMHFSFGEDSKERSGVLVIYSGAVLNFVAPDEEGYVWIYVDKETKKVDGDTWYKWLDDSGNEKSAGSVGIDSYAYDTATYTFQAVELPSQTDALNLFDVSAGNYVIELDNVPDGYQAVTKQITVEDSQEVQKVTIVLKEHEHTSADEWSKDENTHWHNCSGCDEDVKLDSAAHTPGAEATETTAQVCTVCEYVITPALGHTHSYGNKYDFAENSHWKECSCGDKIEEENHTYKWVTDQEATTSSVGYKHEECATCGYKKAQVEIPMMKEEIKIPSGEEIETPSEEESETPSEEESETPSEEESEAPSEEESEIPSEEVQIPSEEESETPSEEKIEIPSEEESETPSEEEVRIPSEELEMNQETELPENMNKVSSEYIEINEEPISADTSDNPISWTIIFLFLMGIAAFAKGMAGKRR